MAKVNPPAPKPIEPRIERLVDAGATLGDAIRIAVGGSIPVWLEEREKRGRRTIHRSIASNTIYSHRKASNDVLDALVEDLGGTRQEWAKKLWQAMKPEETVSETIEQSQSP